MIEGVSFLSCPDCYHQFEFDIDDGKFDQNTKIICPNKDCNKQYTFAEFSMCFHKRFKNQMAFDVLAERLNEFVGTLLKGNKVVGSLLGSMSLLSDRPVSLIVGVHAGQPYSLKIDSGTQEQGESQVAENKFENIGANPGKKDYTIN